MGAPFSELYAGSRVLLARAGIQFFEYTDTFPPSAAGQYETGATCLGARVSIHPVYLHAILGIGLSLSCPADGAWLSLSCHFRTARVGALRRVGHSRCTTNAGPTRKVAPHMRRHCPPLEWPVSTLGIRVFISRGSALLVRVFFGGPGFISPVGSRGIRGQSRHGLFLMPMDEA